MYRYTVFSKELCYFKMIGSHSVTELPPSMNRVREYLHMYRVSEVKYPR